MVVAHDRIPVFQKKGSVLPLNLGDDLKLGSFVGNKTDAFQNLVLRIYPQGEQRIPLYSGEDGAVEWVAVISDEDAKQFTVELPAHKTPLIIEIIDREINAVSKKGKVLETEVSEQGAVRIRLAAESSPSRVVFKCI
jgi:alpha-glucosidase (family GH31 glycosyl hydrolase)